LGGRRCDIRGRRLSLGCVVVVEVLEGELIVGKWGYWACESGLS
jgi:hypothetical protein